MNLQQLLIMGRVSKSAEVFFSAHDEKYAKFSVTVKEYVKAREISTDYIVLVKDKSVEKTDTIKRDCLIMVDGRPEVDAYITNMGEAKANLIVVASKWKVIG